jgi:hypothetical protein
MALLKGVTPDGQAIPIKVTSTGEVMISGVASGDTGKSGSSGPIVISLEVAEAAGIPAYSVVALNDSLKAVLADRADKTQINHVIGISIEAKNLGETIKVVYSGQIENAAWNFNPSLLYIVGSAGVLTDNTEMYDGYLQVVAQALSPTKINVSIQPAIEYTEYYGYDAFPMFKNGKYVLVQGAMYPTIIHHG